jgi:hypothetical protein
VKESADSVMILRKASVKRTGDYKSKVALNSKELTEKKTKKKRCESFYLVLFFERLEERARERESDDDDKK